MVSSTTALLVNPVIENPALLEEKKKLATHYSDKKWSEQEDGCLIFSFSSNQPTICIQFEPAVVNLWLVKQNAVPKQCLPGNELNINCLNVLPPCHGWQVRTCLRASSMTSRIYIFQTSLQLWTKFKPKICIIQHGCLYLHLWFIMNSWILWSSHRSFQHLWFLQFALPRLPTPVCEDVRRGYPEIMHTSPFQNFVHDTVFICPTMKCHISDRDRPATLMQMNASKSWHAGLLVCYCFEVGTWNTNIKVIHARALQNSDRYHHHYCCNWSLKAVQRLEKIGRALAVSANRTWNGYISLLLPLLWAIQLWIF